MEEQKAFWRLFFSEGARKGRPRHELYASRSAGNIEFFRQTAHAVIGAVHGLRILDAGSGEAQISRRYFSNNRVACLDFSVPMLRRIPPGDMGRVAADLDLLPFRAESFDLVICIEAIQCIAEIGSAFRQFARVLPPGGRLIVSTLNAHSLMRSAFRLPHPGWKHTTLRSSLEVAESLRHCGLEILGTSYLTYYLRMKTKGRATPTFGEYARSIAATNFMVEARKPAA